MDLFLRTERLLLRPLVETDIDIAITLFTDPKVVKFVCNVYSRDQLVTEMAQSCARGAGGCIGVWCIVDAETAEKYGSAILLPLPIDLDDTDWSLLKESSLPPGEIEIGYLLKPSAWGKGYATEATRRLLKFAFEETPLEEIVAVTDPKNHASQSVLRKCGLKDEGRRRAYNDDCSGFRISRTQWFLAHAV